jgi:hypothetical protein
MRHRRRCLILLMLSASLLTILDLTGVVPRGSTHPAPMPATAAGPDMTSLPPVPPRATGTAQQQPKRAAPGKLPPPPPEPPSPAPAATSVVTAAPVVTALSSLSRSGDTGTNSKSSTSAAAPAAAAAAITATATTATASSSGVETSIVLPPLPYRHALLYGSKERPGPVRQRDCRPCDFRYLCSQRPPPSSPGQRLRGRGQWGQIQGIYWIEMIQKYCDPGTAGEPARQAVRQIARASATHPPPPSLFGARPPATRTAQSCGEQGVWGSCAHLGPPSDSLNP